MWEPELLMYAESGRNMEDKLQLNKQAIILLGFLIVAAFEKRECESCSRIDYFPFADWKMFWTEYAYQGSVHFVLAVWSFVVWREERNNWSLIAFIIILGYGANFFLRANARFFTVYGYPFGYTAFAALIFMLCLTIQMTNGYSRSRY